MKEKFIYKMMSQLKGKLLLTIVFLFIASSVLITVNFFTVKVNASIRAYIHGESMYSKGQKDAIRHLTEYVISADTGQISLFNKAIAIPKGDGLARIDLINNAPYEITYGHLLEGNNHPDDIGNLIWLFENFINVPFMQKAYVAWYKADSLILNLDALATEIFTKSATEELSKAETNDFLRRIFEVNDLLTVQQLDFSGTLGDAGRKAETYLFCFNFVVIILILVITFFSMYGLVRKLVTQNAGLKIINNELDRFVYSASHDLRAPISSMKGLVEIMKKEDNETECRKYLQLMTEILDRQDVFLKDIIDFSKNKRLNTHLKEIDAQALIDQVIANHQFMEGADNMVFEKQIEVDTFISDEARLLIVMNNLISNAIKYHDPAKEKSSVKVVIRKTKENIVLEVKDNGLGIKDEYKERIFDMFFVTQNKNKGSGLGLYIVVSALEHISGNIELESEINKGSKFIVSLPIVENGKSNN